MLDRAGPLWNCPEENRRNALIVVEKSEVPGTSRTNRNRHLFRRGALGYDGAGGRSAPRRRSIGG